MPDFDILWFEIWELVVEELSEDSRIAVEGSHALAGRFLPFDESINLIALVLVNLGVAFFSRHIMHLQRIASHGHAGIQPPRSP